MIRQVTHAEKSESAPGARPPMRGYRVLFNLSRMMFGLLLGLWLVRLLLVFGADAAATILLLGTGIGLSAITQQLLEMSLTPILGLAYQSNDQRRMDSGYSSAFVASLIVGVSSLALFGILGALVHKLDVPPELLWGARWFILAKALQTVVAVLLAPHTTMYLIQGRMRAYNFNQLSERIGEVVSALAILAIGITDPGTCIAAFGVATSVWRAGYLIVASMICPIGAKISLRSLSDATAEETRGVLTAVRENLLIVIANTSYLRLDQICVNLAGGLQANLVFSIASQLVAYIRLLTHGQAIGLEAASAKIFTQNANQPSALIPLVSVSSRHQAILVLPAVFLLGSLAEPIVEVWLSDRLNEIHYSTAVLVDVLRLLLLGITLRALTEGWMRILNGTGQVKSYARASLWGASLNALLAPVAILTSPAELAVYTAAAVFAVLHVVVYMFWIPQALCRLIEASTRELLSPLLRPLGVAIACLPCLLLSKFFSQWNLISLSLVTACYLATYAAGTLFFSLTKPERAALLESMSRLRLNLFTRDSRVEEPFSRAA
jgi:hypothetical protein